MKPTPRYLNLLYDLGFHHVFSRPENKPFLFDFVNAVLADSQELAEIEFMPMKFEGMPERQRLSIVNFRCKNTAGEVFLVEIHCLPEENFFDRCAFHLTYLLRKLGWMPLFSEQDGPAVYVVGLMGFPFLVEREAVGAQAGNLSGAADDEEEHVHPSDRLIFQFQDVHHPDKSYDRANIIMLNTPSFHKGLTALQTPYDHWVYLLKHLHTMEEVPQVWRGTLFETFMDRAQLSKLTQPDREAYFQG
ncbi:PD-(D/E)XK nuclease family transposase [Pontibacter sp. G13]|uniref:PD-(D/E)XK nuclease family transposase n=1 Tax=Pontibacter sp. G13 TaxID=3074898 RepID=UPI00288A23B9|nr:PD-(D/E)XK nuclease family transposase [Pontibacter sp. G13]WNJ18730.1 PD-(D/E)XK nuclease family transposase [Pontibacter sp. G13]